jgi:hypothetical protein
MFAASKTDSVSVSGGPPDPQFNYVTMLLHGDGTNGAQNNTFIDSSGNNFPITRNGNTTQGSFSPYGSGWSNTFTASSGSYLSVPYSSAFNLTGDFTVECWINPSQLPTGTGVGSPLYPRIFSFGTYDAANSIGLEINSNDVGTVNALVVWYNGSQYYSANNIVAAGNWYHCAIVRSGTTIKIYLNGTSVITITSASAAVNTSQALFIASLQSFTADANACFKGSISNLRVVKGTAVYTNTFTPPTTPLIAITNTVLLTCQSNRFVDNSTTSAIISSFGTPSVQRFNPFGTSTAYSTSVIGGSGIFASSNWLDVSANSAFSFTGSFTVECWVYQTERGLNGVVTEVGLYTDGVMIRLGTIGGIYDAVYVNNNNIGGISTYVLLNSWNHIAVVRSGTSVTVYVNGVSRATGTVSGTVNGAIGGTRIGAPIHTTGSAQPFNGYITDFRIVKGTAVYTTTFTPPTTPLTAITNTSLLTNMTNGAIFDNAMMNDLETVGNAQISTSVKKYGTGSMSFDGTGDWLYSPYTPNLDLGAGNFTVECWAYINATATQALFSINGSNSFSQLQVATSTNDWYLLISTSNNLWVNTTTGGSYSANTWYHVAVVRNGSTFTLYVNGTSVLTQSTSSALYAYGGATRVGQNSDNSLNFNGYIDDFRITKGYARYTANFTPPTAAFSNTGPY